MRTDNIKEEIAQYIGKIVLELRKSHKLSREQFAEKTNLSSNYIYEIEKGNYIRAEHRFSSVCQ